ncbi:MAG: serine hydrolase domain-containing protein [Pseudomonadota bacterium]
MKKVLGLLIVAMIFGSVWFLWPYYGFFSHRGEAPTLPFGWIEMPQDVPASEKVHDARFADAGRDALDAMRQHRANINAPAITAAVAIEGALVWQGAVGLADIAKGRAASADTIVRVGSTSKAITATALARMVQRGDIDLDAPISAYMDELPNASWAEITPRMLASHTAGLPHYGNNDDLDGLMLSMRLNTSYDDIRDALGQIDESALRFPPGSDFEYSSHGTVLLGAVMSNVAGKRYRDLIQDEVLVPAEAASTIVAPERIRAEGLAVPYYTKGEKHRPWRPVDLSHRLPAGGWASTSTDLVRIGSLWLDDTFISPATRALFWTPQTLTNGEANEQDYAIGWRWREWEIEGIGVARNANHGGVSRGGQSWLLVYPDFDMAIAYNMNGRTEDFGPFADYHDEIFVPFARAIERLRAD